MHEADCFAIPCVMAWYVVAASRPVENATDIISDGREYLRVTIVDSASQNLTVVSSEPRSESSIRTEGTGWESPWNVDSKLANMGNMGPVA